MKYALYLGCTVPARARNYELATRRVARELGIEFEELPESDCCGFPLRSVHHETFLLMAARNLMMAEDTGCDLITLCSACTSVLTEVNRTLSRDFDLRKEVMEKLGAKKNYRFEHHFRVRHFARFLYEEIGPDRLRSYVKRDLSGLKIAPHYGCHYLKPSEIYDDFDDPENPKTLSALIAATGATPVEYEEMNRCCGGAVLAIDDQMALAIARKKLDLIKDAGADAICLICPFCSVMFDDNQRGIEMRFEREYNLPVLYYPQLLGLAMGFGAKELGLKMNRVKTAPLLKKLEEVMV
jgi:heterodisulfide reductase subunit B